MAYNKVSTVGRSVEAFKTTGIYPFNRLAIPKEAYEPAKTTEQQRPIITVEISDKTADPPEVCSKKAEAPDCVKEAGNEDRDGLVNLSRGSSVAENMQSSNSTVPDKVISFEEILPLPHHNQRKCNVSRLTKARILSSKDLHLKSKVPKAAKTVKTDRLPIKRTAKTSLTYYLDKNFKKPSSSVPLKVSKVNDRLSVASINSSGAGPSGLKRQRRKEKPDDKIDSSNYCGKCRHYYFDQDNDDEGWIQCPECRVWYHEVCAGVYGRSKFDFICDYCSD